jgi:hypothetical protein
MFHEILTIDPLNPKVNFQLGVLKMKGDSALSSLPFFEQAVTCDPTEPTYWKAYIQALMHTTDQQEVRDVILFAENNGLKSTYVNDLINLCQLFYGA